MKITVGGHELELHAAGAVIWPARGLLAVADLHLEKGSHFAKRGFHLPPYDSRETLERLLALCEAAAVRRLMILGDCFHDAEGFARLGEAERGLFARLATFDPLWIRGNHDGDFVPGGFEAYDVYKACGLTFRHQALPGAADEISAHFHPKTEITHKGARLSLPCFAEDGSKLVLPAFGAYAGGLSAASPAIRALFPGGMRLHVAGNGRIFSLPLKNPEPETRGDH